MWGTGFAALLCVGCFLPLTKASDISPACQQPRQSYTLQQRHGRTLLAIQPPEDPFKPQLAPYKKFIWFNASCHVELDEIVVRHSGVCLLTVSIVSGQGETILVGPNTTIDNGAGWLTRSFPVNGKALRRSISNSNGINSVVFQFLKTPRASRRCVVFPVQHHTTRTGVVLYTKATHQSKSAGDTTYSTATTPMETWTHEPVPSSQASVTVDVFSEPETVSVMSQSGLTTAATRSDTIGDQEIIRRPDGSQEQTSSSTVLIVALALSWVLLTAGCIVVLARWYKRRQGETRTTLPDSKIQQSDMAARSQHVTYEEADECRPQDRFTENMAYGLVDISATTAATVSFPEAQSDDYETID